MTSELDRRELSIIEGGPLHRLQLRLGLMKEQAPRIVRRAVVFAVVAWLPLLILSALQGVLITNVKIPFLYDPAAYSRFLLSVPLLIVAEIVIGPRIAEAARQFITSRLVREENYSDFDAAIADALRLRNSTVAEIIILALTYVGAFEALRIFSSNVSTWNSLASQTGHRFTLAGYWYALVSIPIFQFLVYRWLWRTFIWCRFLWRVSKLNLQLVPNHPDQAGGLGFLGEAHRLFAILSAPDNTSLANYSRGFELVEQTRPFPFEPRTAIVLALAGLIPMVPLLATVMPMQEIFKLLIKVLR
jgi:hypothetical protein